LSWVLSDEPWFHVPFVGSNLGELRFRTAYGQSGKGTGGVLIDQDVLADRRSGGRRGGHTEHDRQSEPRPESGKELEIGFDANGYNDRVGHRIHVL
jgi:hypothetical protein